MCVKRSLSAKIVFWGPWRPPYGTKSKHIPLGLKASRILGWLVYGNQRVHILQMQK